MSRLKFRNITARPSDPVSTWPTEGFIAALERGDLNDWRRIAAAVREAPWGAAARRLEDALAVSQPYGSRLLLARVVADARQVHEAEERTEVAARVRAHLASSGLTRAEFASAVGTSVSRLSTYLNAKVAPSSTMMLRMERVAARPTQESLSGTTLAT